MTTQPEPPTHCRRPRRGQGARGSAAPARRPGRDRARPPADRRRGRHGDPPGRASELGTEAVGAGRPGGRAGHRRVRPARVRALLRPGSHLPVRRRAGRGRAGAGPSGSCTRCGTRGSTRATPSARCREALELPESDLTAATALLDARFVAGDRRDGGRVPAAPTGTGWRARRPAASWPACSPSRRSGTRASATRSSCSSPISRAAPGGIRDLCAGRWAAFARFGTGDPCALRDLGQMSARQAAAFEAARDWLLKVRMALHLEAGPPPGPAALRSARAAGAGAVPACARVAGRRSARRWRPRSRR